MAAGMRCHSWNETMKALKIAIAAACSLMLLSVQTVMAQHVMAGDIKITSPWARATPGGAKVAGGFVTLENTGKDSDRLIGGSLVQAGAVEIHEMKMEGDVMRMRRLEKGLEIKPGETVTLKPGGYHVMFYELKAPFKQGDTLEGTLKFEKGGEVKVQFRVEGLGAARSGHGGGHGDAMKHHGKH